MGAGFKFELFLLFSLPVVAYSQEFDIIMAGVDFSNVANTLIVGGVEYSYKF